MRPCRGNSLCVVDVEEVRVKNGLNDTGNHCNWVVETRHIEEVTVNPVGDVQSSVRAKRKEIVGCDCFRFTCSLQHEELREDSDRLEPDGECPENLPILLAVVPPRLWLSLTSENVYLYGNSIANTALAPNRYCTLNVSRFGSWVGLKSLSMR
jgi:hypothetical protein